MIRFHDSELNPFLGFHRKGGDRYSGATVNMLLNQYVEIHLIQLITRKDQYILKFMIKKMVHALTNGIGCSLKPILVGHSLFGCQQVNKGATERTEMVRILNMTIQRSRIKLREYEHP